MQRQCIAFVLLALATLGHAKANGPVGQLKLDAKKTNGEVAKKAPVVEPAKKAESKVVVEKKGAAKPAEPKLTAKVKSTPKASLIKISPPLKDVSSDKKFFGPPFPADYPDDKRPVINKSILDKLKGPDQPYPALQSKSEYDADYVKDENSDRGHWSAQFEYDSLRRQIEKEKADAARAAANADKHAHDESSAEAEAERARKEVDEAQKDLDDAVHGRKDDDTDDVGPPSEENLNKLKKRVAEAEANYEKEKKQFEECKRQLEDAKTNLAELKARQAEIEQQLAAETKLWVERKSVRLNLKKAKEEAASAKVTAAEEALTAAKQNKAEMDAVLATKKHRAELAKKNAQEQKAKLDAFKKDLERATLRLQKLRGYKPAEAPHSGSSAAVLPLLAFAAISLL